MEARLKQERDEVTCQIEVACWRVGRCGREHVAPREAHPARGCASQAPCTGQRVIASVRPTALSLTLVATLWCWIGQCETLEEKVRVKTRSFGQVGGVAVPLAVTALQGLTCVHNAGVP